MVPASKHAWAEHPPMAHGRLGMDQPVLHTTHVGPTGALWGEAPDWGSMMNLMPH